MAKCSICGRETDIINLTNDKQDVQVICSLVCLDIWKLEENLRNDSQLVNIGEEK